MGLCSKSPREALPDSFIFFSTFLHRIVFIRLESVFLIWTSAPWGQGLGCFNESKWWLNEWTVGKLLSSFQSWFCPDWWCLLGQFWLLSVPLFVFVNWGEVSGLRVGDGQGQACWLPSYHTAGWIATLFIHQASLWPGRMGSWSMWRCWLMQVALPWSLGRKANLGSLGPMNTWSHKHSLLGLHLFCTLPPLVATPSTRKLMGSPCPVFSFQEGELENLTHPQEFTYNYFSSSRLCMELQVKQSPWTLEPCIPGFNSDSFIAVRAWAVVSTFLSLSSFICNKGTRRSTSCHWRDSWITYRRYLAQWHHSRKRLQCVGKG